MKIDSLITSAFRFLAPGLLVLLGGALPAGEPIAERPNILLIMADDMGYECLSSNGSTTYKTPRLDALAALSMSTPAHQLGSETWATQCSTSPIIIAFWPPERTSTT